MRLTRLLLTLVAPVLVLPTAGTASADGQHPVRVVVQDGRHDVVRFAYRSGQRQPVRTRAPGHRVGNFTRMQVTHQATTIVVRLRLVTIGREVPPVLFAFRTPASRLLGFADSTGRPAVDLFTRDFDDIACPGTSVQVRRRARTLRVRIPRACFGEPSWIRVRATTASFGHPSRDRIVQYVDTTPGRRARFLGPKTHRACAPDGAVVTDSTPPVSPERHLAGSRLSLVLRSLGLRADR